MADSISTERIRALNDVLRRRGEGGQILVTRGIQSLGEERSAEIVRTIAAFDAFSADNDPHGEHDCAVMEVAGIRIIWKIDYYDETLSVASPDPSDPKVTRRVLTVMLASEY